MAFLMVIKIATAYPSMAYHLHYPIGDNLGLIYYNNDLREVLRHKYWYRLSYSKAHSSTLMLGSVNC